MILVGAFFSVVLGFFIFYYLNNVLVTQKINEIGQLASEQVHESAQIVYNEQLFARMLATNTTVREFFVKPTQIKKTQLLSFFSDYTKVDKNYLAVYLLDKNGKAVISTDARFLNQDYSFRAYFKKGMSGEPWVDSAVGATSHQFGYYFSHPVYNTNNQIVGVMVVKTASQRIDASIAMSKLSEESTTMLTDENGVVVYSNKKDRFMKSLGTLSTEEKQHLVLNAKFLGSDIAPLQYENIQNIIRYYKAPVTVKIHDSVDDDDEILSVVQIHTLPFFLVSEIGLSDVSAQVYGIAVALTLFVLIGFVLMASILYELITFFIRPLNQLKTFCEKISKGDFEQKVTINTKDEFADLALSFNTMASGLNDLYKHLDEKIKERTSELDASNEKLSKALKEAEKLNKFMVGREMEMIELKKQLSELTEQR